MVNNNNSSPRLNVGDVTYLPEFLARRNYSEMYIMYKIALLWGSTICHLP